MRLSGFVAATVLTGWNSWHVEADCVQGDCKDGYGWWEWSNGDRYFGFFKKMRRHGLGAFYSESGSKYEGAWLNDTKDGHGTWTWADGTRYSGKWRTDLHHGHGIYLFSGGEMYEGDYNLGKRHGHGINTWPSGDRYEGDFVSDKRKGRGRLVSTSGSLYEGDWRDDKIDGLGAWQWLNGNSFRGVWRGGERSGLGLYLYADGSRHLGEWQASREHGRGLRFTMGRLWGNTTVHGVWHDGKLDTTLPVLDAAATTSKGKGAGASGGAAAAVAPYELQATLVDNVGDTLRRTTGAQGLARDTAAAALEAAVQARVAAREAMTLARAAQAISRSKSQVRAAAPGCAPVASFMHGEVHPALDLYQLGDVVSLSCDAGFQLAGGFPLRECAAEGVWSGGKATKPQCKVNALTGAAAAAQADGTARGLEDWVLAEHGRLVSAVHAAVEAESAVAGKVAQAAAGAASSPAPRATHDDVSTSATSSTTEPASRSTANQDKPTNARKNRQTSSPAAGTGSPSSSEHAASGTTSDHLSWDSASSSSSSSAGADAGSGSSGEGSGSDVTSSARMLQFLEQCQLGFLEPMLRHLAPEPPRTLPELLVAAAKQVGFTEAGIYPRDQQRLLACAQTFLLRNRAPT